MAVITVQTPAGLQSVSVVVCPSGSHQLSFQNITLTTVCFSLYTCNSCHSFQNGTVTARHRKPFTDRFSPVFPAAASISSPRPAHCTCTPTPAPISHRPLAIARMFRAPSQLYVAAHVDFCPSLQAREHFFLITIVFHIVVYGSFSALC